MLKWIKKQLALTWAKIHQKQVAKAGQQAAQHQEALLLQMVKTAEKTLFGRVHHFENIKTIQDFQKQVPITDYEGLKPYIDKMKRGQAHILWTGTPEYFAKTSGTTSGAKYIPISKEGMPFQIQAARSALLHYIAQKNNANFVNGKMIFLQGSPELEEVYGIKTGRLSGIVAHHIPHYLQKNRLPSYATNCIDDWETKIHKIADETEHEDMRLISGIPPWLIMYFEILVERHGKPIKALFPNLQLIVTGGVNYGPYRKKMEQLLGGAVDIVQTFPASEGFFAFQDDISKEGLLLLAQHGIFYEFVPLAEFGKPNAPCLTLKEIELHQDYAMIITTNSGLWRYAIGDVVRFISKNPYRILVSGRTKHYTSAFGEHVIAYEVEEAIKRAIAKHPAQITEFHLAPQVTPAHQELPYHEWLIEFQQPPADLKAFAATLDQEMKSLNTYYDDLIQGKVLQPLKITPLKKNAFHHYAKSEGKLGGQNKIPRLANDRTIAEFLETQRLD
ncbi:GH3 auxin-responsive promoter family protein [Riemerella columbina]|uniref:GH3 auxin-responsive promoter family protein n=1 Tax=Riemerella columbina TaxID=103810 RepID=UPI00267016C4|nr:GH3 auxin-responsive promoter family protein [Riemerella columbina]WKS94898.1 GH3 auxin-responsive promoter family protein [Riemerella columbina]